MARIMTDHHALQGNLYRHIKDKPAPKKRIAKLTKPVRPFMESWLNTNNEEDFELLEPKVPTPITAQEPVDPSIVTIAQSCRFCQLHLNLPPHLRHPETPRHLLLECWHPDITTARNNGRKASLLYNLPFQSEAQQKGMFNSLLTNPDNWQDIYAFFDTLQLWP